MGITGNPIHREPWNKGKLVGQKAPFKLKDIWALRVRLQMEGRVREFCRAQAVSGSVLAREYLCPYTPYGNCCCALPQINVAPHKPPQTRVDRKTKRADAQEQAMRLTRRTFIMASGAAAGWLATGCATAPASAPVTSAFVPRKAKASAPAQGDWVGSTCQGCTQWCAIQIFVQDGRAVRVRGNPISKSNHGYVCPRGHMIPQQMYDPDRVKSPMKRTNPAKGRGIDPKFVPISWDEALNTVADKMIELRTAGEPQKLMYMRGRYSPTSTDLLYGTLPKIWGTPNYFSHSAICAEAEKMGPGLTQGFFGYRDIDWSCTASRSIRSTPSPAKVGSSISTTVTAGCLIAKPSIAMVRVLRNRHGSRSAEIR